MNTVISDRAQALLEKTLVWENHACMPLRPGDVTFLPQLERARKSGIDLISLNISFDVLDPRDAFLMLATFRHWIRQHSEEYTLVDTAADIEAAKASHGSRGNGIRQQSGDLLPLQSLSRLPPRTQYPR